MSFYYRKNKGITEILKFGRPERVFKVQYVQTGLEGPDVQRVNDLLRPEKLRLRKRKRDTVCNILLHIKGHMQIKSIRLLV